jgi:predicted amidohydrolase YtcJ
VVEFFLGLGGLGLLMWGGALHEGVGRGPTAVDPTADLVLIHGNFFTLDREHPSAEALAISGQLIVSAGSDNDIRKWIGPKTHVVDLGGRFATAGFNDAHVHLGEAGLAKLAVKFNNVRSLAELQGRIQAALPNYPPGEWMTGEGWDHTLWPEQKFPARQDLDAVSKDRPMLFYRVDGHVAVANSLALEEAHITRETADPPGGHVVKDAVTGKPTGMLEEDSAMNLVRTLVPAPSAEKRRRGIEMALEDASRNGVTSAQDFSSWADFRIYEELKRAGQLKVRITEWLPFELPLDQLEKYRSEGGTSDSWLKTGALKGFMDGSLGSRTASLLAPYSDDPSTSGLLRMEPEDVKRLGIERDRAGFQIAFHAIGDRANRLALDAYEAIENTNAPRDRRDRVEHAQVLAHEDISRFAKLKVIASMQPSHILSDVRWAEQRIGPARAKGAYAWHSLAEQGTRLAFGTDYPIEPINPMRGLYACVARKTPEGEPKGGWEPQERIPVEDCLRDYTAGSAYAEFEENKKGELKPGLFADIAVLSEDVTRCSPEAILKTTVIMTIAGGKITYQAK